MTLVHSGAQEPLHTHRDAVKPAVASIDRTRFTVVFDGDLRAVPGNPFHTVSAFGQPRASGFGDAFAKADALEDALYRAMPFVEDASEDPAYDRAAVKTLLRQIKAALGEAP